MDAEDDGILTQECENNMPAILDAKRVAYKKRAFAAPAAPPQKALPTRTWVTFQTLSLRCESKFH